MRNSLPPPNAFAPLGKSGILSYHSVTPKIFSYHSVNYAIVLYLVAAFRCEVQCRSEKFKISEFSSVIRLDLNSGTTDIGRGQDNSQGPQTFELLKGPII